MPDNHDDPLLGLTSRGGILRSYKLATDISTAPRWARVLHDAWPSKVFGQPNLLVDARGTSFMIQSQQGDRVLVVKERGMDRRYIEGQRRTKFLIVEQERLALTSIGAWADEFAQVFGSMTDEGP